MPRIPVYQQQVTPNGAPSASRMSASAASAEGRGLQTLGAGLNDIAGAVNRQEQVEFVLEKDRIETEGRIHAAKAASHLDLDMAEHLQQLQQSAQPGAAGFTPSYLKRFDEYADGALKNAPSPYARNLLQGHIAQTRESYGKAALVWEAAERSRYTGQQVDEGVQLSAKLVNANPANFEREMGKWSATIEGVSLTPDAKAQLKDIARKNLAWSAVVGEIDRNPIAWAPRAQGGKAAGFDSVVAQILKTEGGYNASDGNSNAPVNFGINQRANPDIDVKSLTPEKAKAIYKERYWDKIGADKLPAELQATAMDAAVNQGVGNAKKWIEQSGGDVTKFNELRREHYEELLKKPENAKFRKSWMGRVEASTGSATDATAVVPETAQRNPAWNLLTFAEQQKALDYADRKGREVRQEAAVNLRYEIQNTEAMARTGTAPTGPARTREEFALAFSNPLDAEHEYARYTTARETASAVSSFNGKSTSELLTVAQAKLDPNDPSFAVKSANQEIRARAAAEVIQARHQDPVAYAMQTGDFKLQPLDMQQPEVFSEELKRRAAALPGMAQKYGRASMLSKVEAQAMAQQLELLSADQKVEQLEVIRGSIGDNAVYASVLNSIRPDSPVTALVGNIAAVGAKENARIIARGEDLLNPTKGGKKVDGAGSAASFPMPQESLMRQAWVDGVGNAYRGYPDAEAAAYQAFRAYYAGAAARKGLNNPAEGPDDNIVAAALKASTGGVTRWKTDWFGNSTPSANIVLPYGMPEDVFRDRVSAEWLRMRGGLGYSKTDVGDIGLYNTGANGEYMVMSGKSWLPGPDGKPVVIRVKAGAGQQGAR